MVRHVPTALFTWHGSLCFLVFRQLYFFLFLVDFSFLHRLISSVCNNGTASLHCTMKRFPPTQLKPATLYSEINKRANPDLIYSCYSCSHVPTDSVAPLFHYSTRTKIPRFAFDRVNSTSESFSGG